MNYLWVYLFIDILLNADCTLFDYTCSNIKVVFVQSINYDRDQYFMVVCPLLTLPI